jgi:hypothetical protein
VSVYPAGQSPLTGQPVWTGKIGAVAAPSGSSQTVGDFSMNVTGGYVKVQLDPGSVGYLSLAEVEVFGVVPVNTGGTLPPPGAPEVEAFVANPDTILEGQASQLFWIVHGGSVSIDNGVGSPLSPRATVTPDRTTTYTLTARNAQGTITRQTTVTVTNITEQAANGLHRTWSGRYSYTGGVCNWTSAGTLTFTIGPLTPQSTAFSGTAAVTGIQKRNISDCSVAGYVDSSSGTISGTISQDPSSTTIHLNGTAGFQLSDGSTHSFTFTATAGGPGLTGGPILDVHAAIDGTFTTPTPGEVGNFRLQ